MRTTVLRVGLIFPFLAFFWLLGSCHREGAPGTVRVGVILPLTGDAAVYGKALKNGVELARSQVPEGSKPQMKLVYEDDQGQANQAVSAAHLLIDVENVPVIIGGAMSSTAEATIPICDSARVVLLSPTATKPSLTHMGKYFLRLWPSDDYDGKVMADVAYNKLSIKRVSILYINLAYGVGITKVFSDEFKRLGGTVLSEDGYAQGATDFRTVLSKIQGEKPDAIYLPGYIAEITQILKQAKELGIKARFLGVNSMYDPKLIAIAGTAAEGAVFTYPTFDPSSQNTTVRDFVGAYAQKYGTQPDAFAAQGYDTYRVLRESLVRIGAGTINGDSILRSLHSLGEFSGPSGKFTFDQYGDVEKPLRLITVRDGKFVPYAQ